MIQSQKGWVRYVHGLVWCMEATTVRIFCTYDYVLWRSHMHHIISLTVGVVLNLLMGLISGGHVQ